MFNLPIDYVTNIFLQYAGFPDKISSGYRASCPMCMEGTSWGDKKRLYYFPNDHYMFCHNGCGSFSDYFWVKKITGKSFSDIKEEITNGYDLSDLSYDNYISLDDDSILYTTPTLPQDSINLMDKTQVRFYRKNIWVKRAISFLNRRKMLKAPFRPKSFYISLNDKVHKNRLIIPFYDDDGLVEFYQSRALTDHQAKIGKFLSKFNSDKPIFNLSKINFKLNYIFIMEGAIDAMFLQNGVAISGVHLTSYQDDLLQRRCPFLKKVWIYDNPKIDDTGREKLLEKVKGSNDLFFTWGDKFEKYKDLNEYCVNENVWSVNPDEIICRSYLGGKSILKI